jgi:hypothetical protein
MLNNIDFTDRCQTKPAQPHQNISNVIPQFYRSCRIKSDPYILVRRVGFVQYFYILSILVSINPPLRSRAIDIYLCVYIQPTVGAGLC